MADIVAELQRVADGIVLTLRHPYSELLYSDELSYDFRFGESGFSEVGLRQALTAYRQRILEGLVMYRRNGQIVRGTPVALDEAEAILPGSVPLDDLIVHDFVISLHFASDNPEQELDTVSFDFNNWRRGISTTIICKYPNDPTIAFPVLWDERGLYPLFPTSTATTTFMGMEVLAVPSLNSRGVGFSTVSVERDHLRHELLLPASTALDLLGWEHQPPAAHEHLGDAERQRLAAALLERAANSQFANNAGRVLDAEKRRIRWFDRASLRRGLPLGERSAPVATSFIGLIEIYRPPPNSTTLMHHDTWYKLAPSLTFTARHGDQVLTRRTDRELNEPWEWTLAPLALSPAPAFLPPSNNLHYLIWILAGPALAIGVAWRRGRWPLLITAGGIACIVLVMPRDSQAVDQSRLEQQLQYAYQSASGTDERHGLQALQLVCTPGLAAQLHVESRRRLAGPWAVRSGLEIEAVTIDDIQPVASQIIRTSWTVRCRIRHWGHGHDRAVQFAGLLGLADDGRLASIELLDKQLVAASSNRLSGAIDDK